MTTSNRLHHGKLLVDYEDGRVLRADDELIVSERVLDSHPFVETADGRQTFSVGPDARRHAIARARREGTTGLDAIEYEVHGSIAGLLTLRKKVDA